MNETSTTFPRTLHPINRSAFDSAFPPAPRPAATPHTEQARLYRHGETYSLTRVVMPNGEVRRFARQYNGYGEAYDVTPEDRARSMSYDGAWSMVEVQGYTFNRTVVDARAGDTITVKDGRTYVTGRLVYGWDHDLTSSNGTVYTRARLVFSGDVPDWTGPHSTPIRFER